MFATLFSAFNLVIAASIVPTLAPNTGIGYIYNTTLPWRLEFSGFKRIGFYCYLHLPLFSDLNTKCLVGCRKCVPLAYFCRK